MKLLTIGTRKIGDGYPVFIICEAGVTNYGDIRLARKQIDAAVAAGADAVKFQLWRTENLVSQRVAKRLEQKLGYNWFDRLKYKELSKGEIRSLSAYAKRKNILFFATPHDDESIEYLAQTVRVPVLKVGSGESHNYEFLKKIGATKKPVIISFGMQSAGEIKKAIEVLRRAGAPIILPMHCVTMYPTPYEMTNLPRINALRKLTRLPVGFSDHSVGYHALLAAIALGACVVEKHLTFDKSDPRSLDNPGALLPAEFKKFVLEARNVEQALKNVSEKKFETALSRSRRWAGQAIVAYRAIKAGERIRRTMLAFKRPALGGIPSDMVEKVIGKRARRALPADEQITFRDIIG